MSFSYGSFYLAVAALFAVAAVITLRTRPRMFWPVVGMGTAATLVLWAFDTSGLAHSETPALAYILAALVPPVGAALALLGMRRFVKSPLIQMVLTGVLFLALVQWSVLVGLLAG